jgi:hypothetical protein
MRRWLVSGSEESRLRRRLWWLEIQPVQLIVLLIVMNWFFHKV